MNVLQILREREQAGCVRQQRLHHGRGHRHDRQGV